MKCTNCQTLLQDDAKFCPECGQSVTPAPATAFCSNCGAALVPNETFCGNCGVETAADTKTPTKTRKRTKLPIVPILGAAAAVLAVILLFTLIPGKSSPQVVYLKDGQLQYLNLSKNGDPLELTDNLSESTFSNTYPSTFLKFTEDGKRMFFPDRIDGDTYTLLYMDTTGRKREPLKIDSNVTGAYQINEAGNRIAYIKDDKLYLHDLTEKTKITGDVSRFYLSQDGKSILYITGESEDYRIYLKKGNREEEKLASGVSSVVRVSDDLSTILYRKEDKLYIIKNGRDPEKIASDVASVWASYDSGTCYFTKQGDQVSLWSHVADDVNSESSAALKKSFENYTIDNPVGSLYYFDGKECTLVTDYARNLYNYHRDQEILVFSGLPNDDLPQVKLSDFMDEYTYSSHLETAISDACNEACRLYVLQKGKVSEINLDAPAYALISSNGKKLLVMANLDEKTYTYTGYEVSLSGRGITIEKLDDDLCDIAFLGEGNNYVSAQYAGGYQDDYSSQAWDLYHNGVRVAEDLNLLNIRGSRDGSRMYYICDYDRDSLSGTLLLWNGKENTEIDDDVYNGDFTEFTRSKVLYISDYSVKNEEGDLVIWNGRKSTKLDRDVTCIIKIYQP